MIVVLGVTLGLFINGLRIAIIGIWSFLYGNVSFHGPNDMLMVVSIFVGGTIILVILSQKLDIHNENMEHIGKRNLIEFSGIEIKRNFFIGVSIILLFISGIYINLFNTKLIFKLLEFTIKI